MNFDIRTKVVYCKRTNKWVLIDSDGWTIAVFTHPSKARKAKRYWYLYLTLEVGSIAYLARMAELQQEFTLDWLTKY